MARGSMKPEFLMLAHKFKPAKYHIPGWFLSEKLDGQRFFWDGGVTRNMYATDVPWANTAKDARLVSRPIATGLWSRYGNIIHAPNWWIDCLPPIFLDGELYSGRGRVQSLAKIIRRHEPNPVAWREVKAAVLDSPPLEQVFKDREIDNKPHYVKSFKGFIPWVQVRAQGKLAPIPADAYVSFHRMVKFLSGYLSGNQVCYALEQEQLEFTTQPAIERIEARLKEIVESETPGEGVVIRKHTSIWVPGRSHEILKYKPYDDAEATVIGYVWGRETDRGSKLMGMMGAMVCQFDGVRLELSGFKDWERTITPIDPTLNVFEEGKANAGQPIDPTRFVNSNFPLGSRVTFRYRELSNDGIPKEARYHRKEIVI